jgi:hypothetical protein
LRDTPVSTEVTELFQLLQSPRRRGVLRHVASNPDRDSFDAWPLAREIAAWEYETDPAAVTPEEHQRVYVSLYQTHLPRLDEAALVEYDADEKVVHSTELLDRYEPYLRSVSALHEGLAAPDETAAETRSRWPLVAAALTGVVLAVVTIGFTQPTSSVEVLLGLLTVAFGLGAFGDWLHSRLNE